MLEFKNVRNMFDISNISKYKVELMGLSAIVIFVGHCARVGILPGGAITRKY